MEWHAQSAVVEPEDAAAKAAPEPDSAGWPSYLGWPSVKQQSSLFEFLEKCGEGAVINCIAEDTTVQKTSDNRWHPTQRSATIGETCSSEAVVRAIRSARPQPERGDYSKLIVIATPWDPMSVKKEIVESAEQDDEEVESEEDAGAGASEMSLQFVDLTDDAPIPAPPVAAASGEKTSALYDLHLHLKLPGDVLADEPKEFAVVTARLEVQDSLEVILTLSVTEPFDSSVQPEDGMRITVEGRQGLIWKVSSKKIAVVFDDGASEYFQRAGFQVQPAEAPTDKAIVDVLQRRVGDKNMPSGYLYQSTSRPSDTWRMYYEYKPTSSDREGVAESPVAFALEHGDSIDVLERLIPVRKRQARGRPTAAASAASVLECSGFEFQAVVLGAETPKKPNTEEGEKQESERRPKHRPWAMVKSLAGDFYLAAFTGENLRKSECSRSAVMERSASEAAAQQEFAEFLCKEIVSSVQSRTPIKLSGTDVKVTPRVQRRRSPPMDNGSAYDPEDKLDAEPRKQRASRVKALAAAPAAANPKPPKPTPAPKAKAGQEAAAALKKEQGARERAEAEAVQLTAALKEARDARAAAEKKASTAAKEKAEAQRAKAAAEEAATAAEKDAKKKAGKRKKDDTSDSSLSGADSPVKPKTPRRSKAGSPSSSSASTPYEARQVERKIAGLKALQSAEKQRAELEAARVMGELEAQLEQAKRRQYKKHKHNKKRKHQ